MCRREGGQIDEHTEACYAVLNNIVGCQGVALVIIPVVASHYCTECARLIRRIDAQNKQAAERAARQAGGGGGGGGGSSSGGGRRR